MTALKKIILFSALLYTAQYLMGITLDAMFRKSTIYKSSVIYSRTESLKQQDIIIMGGSNGLVSYNTTILSEEWQKKIYNLSEDDTNIKVHLLQLKLLIAQGIIPKTIILNIGVLGNKMSRNALRYLPLVGHNDMVNDFYYEDNKLKYFSYRFFPITKWAEYNNDLLYTVMFASLVDTKYRHRFDENGEYEYPTSTRILPAKSESSAEIKFDADDETLDAFRLLCMEKKIRLLIVNTPYHNHVVKWSKQKDDVYNFSEIFKQRNDIFYDQLHLNRDGKKEYSMYVSTLLKPLFVQ